MQTRQIGFGAGVGKLNWPLEIAFVFVMLSPVLGLLAGPARPS